MLRSQSVAPPWAMCKRLDFAVDPKTELVNILRKRVAAVRKFVGEMNAKIDKAADSWHAAQFAGGEVAERTLAKSHADIGRLHKARVDAWNWSTPRSRSARRLNRFADDWNQRRHRHRGRRERLNLFSAISECGLLLKGDADVDRLRI